MWGTAAALSRGARTFLRLPRVAAPPPRLLVSTQSSSSSVAASPRGGPAFRRFAAALPSSAGAAMGPAATTALLQHGPLGHGPGAVRGFYFPRKNWFPWRTRLLHLRQAGQRKKRHIWPRNKDPNENPIFYEKEDGNQLAFRERDVHLGMKRLLDYCKIIRGRQVEDAIDWIESLARMKSGVVLKLLRKIVAECAEKHKWDIARVYIFDAQPQRGPFVKSLKKHARSNFGIVKSPRNMCMIRVRQLPLEEYFHRIYIYNKVPRSLSSDMRLALQQNRVSTQMQKEWGPYVCASSRFFHRKTLKWMDSTRQFDYYQARHDWIQRYRANQLRGSVEAREARGLSPMPVPD